MKWFKHSGAASRDAKLAKILDEYGLVGYGLYFYCLELIASKTDSDDLSFELEHDAALIASWTHTDTLTVEKVMHRCIELDLFGIADNGHLTCFKLIKWIDRKLVGEETYKKMTAKIETDRGLSGIIGDNPLLLEENRLEETRPEKKTELSLDASKKDGLSRIELARSVWNEVMPRKPYRYNALNMGEQVRSECLRPMAVYTDEEISCAIRNYQGILDSPEHEIKSPYESFHGFMRSGVEKFVQEADPWTAYKKRSKGFETAAEREERERAEAIERIGKMGA